MIYYSSEYNHPDNSFDTFAKSAKIADIAARTFQVEPPPLDLFDSTETAVGLVHSADYINAVLTGEPRDLAESNGFEWDPATFRTAFAHNHGVVAAAVYALAEQKPAVTLSSGLHHAAPDYGNGFCTFNGIAAAAAHVGVHVAVVDVDAHCGGGTVRCLEQLLDTGAIPKADHFDVATNQFDAYTSSGWAHLDLPGRRGSERYFTRCKHAVNAAVEAQPALIIYNAGVDPLDDGVTARTLRDRDCYAAEVFRKANIPVVVTMAGGYYHSRSHQERVVIEAHLATITEFLG